MKAWVLKDVGGISFQETDMPIIHKGEARIRVMSAGICGSDIPRIYETGAHRMPLIPGHEFSGIVEGIAGDVQPSWMGKRVAVCPKIPCGKCSACKAGSYEMCMDYDYIGSRRNGAFAEFVTVPASQLIELPEGVSFDAGAMLEPLAVAANAVRRGCRGKGRLISPHVSVAVCGLGTIGLMVVMFLIDAGFFDIFVIGKTKKQEETAKSFGIPDSYYCNSRKNDPVEWLKERTEGRGVGIFFDCAGNTDSISYGLRAGASGCRQVLIGNPGMDILLPKDVYWEILRKQMTLLGIWNSSFRQEKATYDEEPSDDWNYALRRLEEGQINPEALITHRLPLERLGEGLTLMRDKMGDYTKILTLPSSAPISPHVPPGSAA